MRRGRKQGPRSPILFLYPTLVADRCCCGGGLFQWCEWGGFPGQQQRGVWVQARLTLPANCHLDNIIIHLTRVSRHRLPSIWTSRPRRPHVPPIPAGCVSLISGRDIGTGAVLICTYMLYLPSCCAWQAMPLGSCRVVGRLSADDATGLRNSGSGSKVSGDCSCETLIPDLPSSCLSNPQS